MNERALSQVGEPVLIEDAMSYWELLQDNEALRQANDRLLAALKTIRACDVEAWVRSDGRLRPRFAWLATIAIHEEEGAE